MQACFLRPSDPEKVGSLAEDLALTQAVDRCESPVAMNVRSAEAGDLAIILEIYNEAILTTTATYDMEPQGMAERVAWYEDHVHSGYPVLVAETPGDGVVGWGSLGRFHQKPGYRYTVENSVYVRESHRGRGIGRVLLRALVDAAERGGWRAILALIDAENEVSLRLHASLGFERVAHLKSVGHKFERWLDVIYMERQLY